MMIKKTHKTLLQLVDKHLKSIIKENKYGNIDLEKYYDVETQLNLANLSKDVTMPAVFGQLIGSIQNRSMMPNVIKYWKYRNDVFDQVLKQHSPSEVLKAYSSAEELYKAIRAKWVDSKPLEERCKGLWKQWCEGVLSSANFLCGFENVKELHNSFARLYDNLWTRPALPSVLAMEISGIQFTLACDFLKECGYDYPKPDVHVTDVFEPIIGTRNPYLVYKEVVLYADALNMTAYKFDKMIWLVCSGNFYKDNIKLVPRKDELIKEVKNFLGNSYSKERQYIITEEC